MRLPVRPAASLVTALLTACSAAPALAQDVELYDQPEFGGIRLTLSTDTPDLADYGIGGRVASVVVRRGQWEFCTQPQFGGACITVGPGRYGQLPSALRGNVASLREVGQVPPPSVGGTPATPVVPGLAAQPAVVLYEHRDFKGRALSVVGPETRLDERNFNDTASSVEVFRGRWQLCVHADYQGACRVLGPGRYALSAPLHDSISSLRPVFGPGDQPLPRSGGVTLYEHADFTGRPLMRTEAVVNLKVLGFNDRASSIEVHAGRWELCSDAGFGGQCLLFEPGRYVLPPQLADRVSSLRPR